MFEGSVALWMGGSVRAVALRRVVAPSMGTAAVRRCHRWRDMVFGMALAWWVNREETMLAISGPFGYARR